MVPFEPKEQPRLSKKPVFIGAGRRDAIVAAEESERLAELLRRAGARVTLHWENGGHEITKGEVEAARDWLTEVLAQ